MKLRTRIIIVYLAMIGLPMILMFGAVFFIDSRVEEISDPLFLYLFAALFVALIISGTVMVLWVKRDFWEPVNELGNAMKQIRDGNFDHVLAANPDNIGEIGEMYKSYEDMRLRLKESAEEKLLREQQNKELISNITHDLKTPITAIKGYSQGLIDGVADTPERQMKYIRTIYNKVSDMDNLINELTLYSSIDNNRIPYNFKRLVVTDYFADCVDELGTDLENKGITLDYINLTTRDTVIIADPEQLKRVVNNIVSNSVKYLGRSDDTGRIELRILDENDSIRIEIEDNGQGIDQEDIPHIFDRFYRTDASRGSKTGGSGIGLSIVKKIVDDHGGYIWATSVPGEGTCMHFVLRKYRERFSSIAESRKEEEEDF